MKSPDGEGPARAALAAVCVAEGLDPRGADVVRVGSNTVFRLRQPAVIARVMRGAWQLENARREAAISRWLSVNGIPVIHPYAATQPVVAGEFVVTLWESVSEHPRYGNTAELGTILRRLHAVTPPPELNLPTYDPEARARDRINESPALNDDERAFLYGRLEQCMVEYRGVRFQLSPGPIHGDANVGNLLRGRTGELYLSDLDDFSVGPREWDLVLTALYFERYGWHSAKEYADFVDSYGFDITSWSGYGALADLRELLMVAWMAWKAKEGPALHQELGRRLESLRTGLGRRRWRAF